jgi:hypothetical protein
MITTLSLVGRGGGTQTLSATSATFSVVVLDTIGDACNNRDVGRREVRAAYPPPTRKGMTDIVRWNMLGVIYIALHKCGSLLYTVQRLRFMRFNMTMTLS